MEFLSPDALVGVEVTKRPHVDLGHRYCWNHAHAICNKCTQEWIREEHGNPGGSLPNNGCGHILCDLEKKSLSGLTHLNPFKTVSECRIRQKKITSRRQNPRKVVF